MNEINKEMREKIEKMLEERRKKAEEKLIKAKIYTNCLVSELERKLGEEIEVDYFDTIYGPAAELIISDVQAIVYPFKKEEKFLVFHEDYNWPTNSITQLYYLINSLI